MNNFVFGSADPLLYNQIVPRGNQQDDLRRQLDTMMVQYQSQLNEQPQQKDYLGELDNMIKSLNEETSAMIASNAEFTQLNGYIQQLIQDEIMRTVKWKINSNQDAVTKIERLKTIIHDVNKEKENEDKRNLSELNDYIKNYSDLTFNEYKQLKQSKA